MLEDNLLLDRWLSACLRIVPTENWLRWLEEILSETNLGKKAAEKLTHTLMGTYNNLPDEAKINYAPHIALPLTHLPIINYEWTVSLFHTSFAQRNPYHRSSALFAIEKFGHLLQALVGSEGILETWEKIQAVERLFQ